MQGSCRPARPLAQSPTIDLPFHVALFDDGLMLGVSIRLKPPGVQALQTTGGTFGHTPAGIVIIRITAAR